MNVINKTFTSYYNNAVLNIKKSKLLYRFASGSFWGLLSSVITRILSMATVMIIARILGKDKFGVYGMVQSTIGMFGLIAGISMGGTLTKYISEYKYRDVLKTKNIINLLYTFSLISSFLVMLIIILSSTWLAKAAFNRNEFIYLLYLGAVYLFISTINNVQQGAIAGFENFKEIARINIIQGITTILFSLPLVYFFSVEGAMISLIITNGISCFISEKILKEECIKYKIDKIFFDKESISELPVIWRYSIPSMMSALLIVPAMWGSNCILVNKINGYSELGLFNAANQFRQLILFIPQILASVTLPIISEIHGRDSGEDFFRALKINIRFTWSIALPLTIFVIIFRHQIQWLFGSQYNNMSYMFVLLMITAFLNIINNTIGTTLLGIGKIWNLVVLNLIWGIMLIILVYLLTPIWGGYGMAMAYLITTIITTIATIIYTELYLAPKAFISEISLLGISIISIVAITLSSINDYNSFVLGFLLLFVSCIPLLKISYKFVVIK